MPEETATQKQLLLELEDLRARLDEAEETLRAIRSGDVDALVVSGAGGEQVFTLKGADHSYRILIEDMSEGALTLTAEGVILYANRRFAEMLKTPLEKVIGSTIHTWIAPDSQRILQSLLRKGVDEKRRAQLALAAGDGTRVPVYLSVSNLLINEMPDSFCLVATDLTEQKRGDAIVASEKLTLELLAASNQSRLALLSVVEDQKQAEEALRESNRRLAALNRVGLALAETLELPAICRTAYEHVSQLVDVPCFGISLYDASSRLLRAGYLFSDGELLDSTRFPPLIIEDAPPIQGRTRAILTQQPEIVTDLTAVLSEATIVVGAPDDQRVPLSALYVPITARGQTIGLLEMQSYRGQAYGDAEVGLLRPVANQIGLAIENARLFAELQVERDSLAQRVRDRTAQLQAANQELEAFAYSVSHDLRAPLRALDGFSAALLSQNTGQLDDQGRHYLGRIQQASQRMGQLISDLLNLSRVTRAELTRQPVDLAALAREIAAELRQRDPQRQAEFVIAERLETEGDSRLLRIVLQNLLENAWKFTGPRPLARIEVGKMTIADCGLRIADNLQSQISNLQSVYFVRDNGVGFDMAYANKLFAPFQRLHGVQEFPGTGIGLATVQRIVTRHGGRIWTEAAVDGGATFYFTLGDRSGDLGGVV